MPYPLFRLKGKSFSSGCFAPANKAGAWKFTAAVTYTLIKRLAVSLYRVRTFKHLTKITFSLIMIQMQKCAVFLAFRAINISLKHIIFGG